MGTVLLLVRWGLAAVFVVAGFGKLSDLAHTRRVMIEFGVPASLTRPASVLLPLAELATAAALLPPGSARWGSLAALCLMVGFTAGIGWNLRRGHRPHCGCLGRVRSVPVGPATLARNGVLAVGALLVVGAGGGRFGGHVSPADPAFVVASALTLALLVAASWTAVRQGRPSVAAGGVGTRVRLQRARGLAVGDRAPGFELPDLDGKPVSLQALLCSSAPAVLVFVNPVCGPCRELLPSFAHRRDGAGAPKLAFISTGGNEENRHLRGLHQAGPILLQHGTEVAEAYGASGTPSAVAVRSDGRIGSRLALGQAPVLKLIEQAAGRPPEHRVKPRRPDHFAGNPATGYSRRGVLRIGAGMTGAALAWLLPTQGFADTPNGNDACAHFCNSVFPPGRNRGSCKSAAAHGRGPCFECGPMAPPGTIPCGSGCCQPGEVCCNGQCRPPCPEGQVLNPSTCQCECNGPVCGTPGAGGFGCCPGGFCQGDACCHQLPGGLVQCQIP
jgi:uncharacterized membrane protein YphA (DoxX/SURF4 family)/peroxiredoxin